MKLIIVTKGDFITANNIKNFFENNFIKPKVLFIKINIIFDTNLGSCSSNSSLLPKLLSKPKTQPSTRIYKLDDNWIKDNNNKNNNKNNSKNNYNNKNNYENKDIPINIQTRNLLYSIIILIEIGANNKYPHVGRYNKLIIKGKPRFKLLDLVTRADLIPDNNLDKFKNPNFNPIHSNRIYISALENTITQTTKEDKLYYNRFSSLVEPGNIFLLILGFDR
jgi:hypothetical protein